MLQASQLGLGVSGQTISPALTEPGNSGNHPVGNFRKKTSVTDADSMS